MKKETYVYPSTGARMKAEYKIFIVAFVFIVIADSIGQIQVPLGPGTLILFPIFYSLIMGVLAGPEVLKIFNRKEVKAASKLVIVAICPFIAKLGINAGASIEVILSAGPALIFQEIGNLGTIFLALPFALLLGLKREAIGATHSTGADHRHVRAGFAGNQRKSVDLCGRRHGGNHLLWIYDHDGRVSGDLSSLCAGDGLGRGCGNPDGQRYGKPGSGLPGDGVGTVGACKYQ